MCLKYTYGIAKGLREGEFADLTPACRKKLLALISRISEASFRRGLQHGEFFTLKNRKLWIKTADLRFDVSLDESPFFPRTPHYGDAPFPIFPHSVYIRWGKWGLRNGFADLERKPT